MPFRSRHFLMIWSVLSAVSAPRAAATAILPEIHAETAVEGLSASPAVLGESDTPVDLTPSAYTFTGPDGLGYYLLGTAETGAPKLVGVSDAPADTNAMLLQMGTTPTGPSVSVALSDGESWTVPLATAPSTGSSHAALLADIRYGASGLADDFGTPPTNGPSPTNLFQSSTVALVGGSVLIAIGRSKRLPRLFAAS